MAFVPKKLISAAVRTSLLRPASLSNRTVLNFWKPGYKIENIVVGKDGQELKTKVFVPTSTTEAAVAYLAQYGSEKFERLKNDIHPGHSSVETGKEYLSVGTLDPVNTIGTRTCRQLTH
jgi:hypothetical protein